MTVGDNLLKKVVDRILTVAKPERIILFGSAATGLMTRDSDLDLLIIERDFEVSGKKVLGYVKPWGTLVFL